ncbi:hypothetical protein [Streptomyces sp. G45]|uniref:hypothetical protein n=1 Tax=Streptomyces sp. G45 TaxID=3406627 RepID=UPI003C138293
MVEQLATAALLNAGHTRRPATLQALRTQRDALHRALTTHLPDAQAPHPPGGLTLWASFPHPLSSRLAAVAPDHGITLSAGPRFGLGGAFARNVRLPYTLPPAQLTEAVRRLADAREAVAGGAVGVHGPAVVV